MTRIFVHAGFHKTGTKTVQHFLHQNGPVIWPRSAIVLPSRLRQVTRIGFWYQDLPEPGLLDQWQEAMETFLRSLDLAPAKPGKAGRDLIISAENLLGRMPNQVGPDPYPVAVDLLDRLIRALGVLPQPAETTVYLSQRQPQDWLRSVHSHLALKSRIRLREDLDQFTARLGQLSLADQARHIAAALPVRVITHDIATLAEAPFGIAQPFVDFLNLPAAALARLTPVGHVYRSAAPELVAALIALNNSALDGDALVAAKQALIRGNSLAGTDMWGNPR
ncbi:hypothetical protein FNJ84_08690 [Paracoccus sp. M683]|uniref:hypothetical protein n=1 Tax=Paracoccus sp. M683 TaxID=2594268 RepID=UPI00117D9090|nr:hypothetical protein [Paracoccus sp. M683]TRW97571.1 hypothetical protein FNJ84_08690 [Paracoccus sp. M683]